MFINKITIRNFKGLENKIVEFKSNMNVVIGNNTAGKTSLLKAVAIGVGGYLQCLKKLEGGKNFRCKFNKGDRFLKFNEKNRDYVANSENPRIDIDSDFPLSDGLVAHNRHIHWYREMTPSGSTTHNRTCVGELMGVVDEMERMRWSSDMNLQSVYPLVLSFGTNRIDAQYHSYRKTEERQKRLDRGYRAALMSDTVDFTSAMQWLIRFDKESKDEKNFEGNKEAFINALTTAIPALSQIEIDNRELEAVVCVNGRRPERHHYSFMSDGFKAMISIVSEIAYRCIMLNGYLGSDAVKQTPGVVLIDEVDLYLHPHWQRHVLDDLQNAFPSLQFIVTTHSPFIVQSAKKDQLISFDDNVSLEGEPFKQSLEEVAETRMGMENQLRSQRYKEMLDKAEEYFNLVKEGNADTAYAESLKQTLDNIEAEFSDDPAYCALLRTEGGKE